MRFQWLEGLNLNLHANDKLRNIVVYQFMDMISVRAVFNFCACSHSLSPCYQNSLWTTCLGSNTRFTKTSLKGVLSGTADHLSNYANDRPYLGNFCSGAGKLSSITQRVATCKAQIGSIAAEKRRVIS